MRAKPICCNTWDPGVYHSPRTHSSDSPVHSACLRRLLQGEFSRDHATQAPSRTLLVVVGGDKRCARGIMQRRLRRLVDAERSRGRHVDSASPTTSAATLAGLTRSAKNRQRVCRTPASRSRGASTRSCCRVVNAEADAADAASVSWRTRAAHKNQFVGASLDFRRFE